MLKFFYFFLRKIALVSENLQKWFVPASIWLTSSVDGISLIWVMLHFLLHLLHRVFLLLRMKACLRFLLQ